MEGAQDVDGNLQTCMDARTVIGWFCMVAGRCSSVCTDVVLHLLYALLMCRQITLVIPWKFCYIFIIIISITIF